MKNCGGSCPLRPPALLSTVSLCWLIRESSRNSISKFIASCPAVLNGSASDPTPQCGPQLSNETRGRLSEFRRGAAAAFFAFQAPPPEWQPGPAREVEES